MVVVARELRASDTASMDNGRILGFVTELGGKESHAAILARSMGVPAIVGVSGILDRVSTGETIALDGETGAVVIGPSADTSARYERLREENALDRDELASVLELPAVTRDGQGIDLLSNAGSVADALEAEALGAAGIGLLRTELLFMSESRFLDEEAQYETYRAVAEALGGKPVTIRTLDIGGDKFVGPENPFHEHNPNLGYRSTRVLLERPDLFQAQLRAILRAGVHGDVRILLPMISSVEELRGSLAAIASAKASLTSDGAAFSADVKVGVMIEIPSAAMSAEKLARECDFLSIGTNDLVQYALAVDRGSSYVSRLYRPHDPAVLALIARAVEGGRSAGKPVSLCGEMAGAPAFVPLLLGLGLRELSVSNSLLPATKKAVREVELPSAEELARKALEAATAADVASLLGMPPD